MLNFERLFQEDNTIDLLSYPISIHVDCKNKLLRPHGPLSRHTHEQNKRYYFTKEMMKKQAIPKIKKKNKTKLEE